MICQLHQKNLLKFLNLSPAAISMALNNKPGVSTATRKLVMETADKYGYDFSKLAEKHNLKGTIYFVIYKKHGAVVSDTPFFFLNYQKGFALGCKKADYKLKISYVYEDEDMVEKQLEEIQYSDCIGMIVLGTEMKPEDLKPFQKLPIPFVLIDSYFETVSCDCVLINNVQGAYLAASHLIRKTKKPAWNIYILLMILEILQNGILDFLSCTCTWDVFSQKHCPFI